MGRVSDSILMAHARGEHDALPLASCGLCAPSTARPTTVPPSDVVAPGGGFETLTLDELEVIRDDPRLLRLIPPEVVLRTIDSLLGSQAQVRDSWRDTRKLMHAYRNAYEAQCRRQGYMPLPSNTILQTWGGS